MYTEAGEHNPENQPGIREKIHKAKIEIKKAARKNYYKIIGVDKNATEKEIKKAYRLGAMKWHPDKWSTGTEEEKQNAEVMFKEIGECYGVLGDEKKKKMYDDGHDIEEINQGGGGGHS
jgi:DnaJ family protein C protein 7